MQQPPEKIDKYQILSVIGKGAMGVVYHAYDPVVKRDVAIKLLSAIGAEETELISRFEREARLAGSLRHPNIVTIYDLGHYEGRPYIVMEHIVGRDLQAVIKQKQELTYEQKVEIVLQISKGLDAAHQKGIIHRDIKPANIRLQEDNTLKIMDFGIARMGTSELTRSGYIIGTLQYMSPEQISGDQLDPRTDIFSTGVIAYELFTYNNPFNGEHTVDIMYRILNVRPQPIQDLPEEYGTELNTVIMRALEKNKELRYPNAKEMSQDLEEYLFYLKSLKFRRKTTARNVPYTEGATQTIPIDQLPRPPKRDPEVPPTMQADVANMPTYHMPSPNFGLPEPPREEEKRERVPRTGIGANYSETAAQVLMTQQTSGWQERKFYILGAVLALLFIAGLVFFATVGQAEKTLAFISTPAGAEVVVNGESVGRTPISMKEKEKDLDVVFRLNGYKEKQVPVQKNQWPAEVSVTLDPVVVNIGGDSRPPKPPPPATPRVIQLVTNPPGANAVLDGKDQGKTPANLTIPDDQPHQLALQLEGYEPLQRTIDPKTPETLSLNLTPTQAAPATGTIQYSGSFPVSIYYGGKVIKGNPPELEPGTYKLTFRTTRNAYVKFTKTVEIKAGEATVVTGPPMGKLTIKAVPSNCKIFINGDYLDVAPVFNRPIQAGAHRIQFSWETLGKTQTQTVTISGGQTETITGIPE